jgi:putative exporter of polyketide antibiotics
MAQNPNNPYQPSVQPGPMVTKPGGSSGKASAAGIALMIVGGLGLLFILGSLIFNMVMGPNAQAEQMKQFEGNEQMKEIIERMENAGPVMDTVFTIIGIVNSCLILVAGYMMRKMTNYKLALVGAICAAVPCLTPMDCCCLIEVGIGIWALVVLMQADVKAMFS